ncbi:aminotransferase [Rhizobium leguminosarum]|uniref:Putative aminotransfera n=1 Tax=Rhizobium leguminosarum TaxID=384 RepID=A0A2K9ZCD1_RHILE|nr:aminotransferase [Rhizobium leguminosarum]AUW45927.1 putative aminotransfera [Rhizobium leguminosarum]
MLSNLDNSPHSRDIQSHAHPQTNFRAHEQIGPMIIDSGNGVRIRDDNGRDFIDGMAGLWCTSLGFSEQRLIDAACRQMRKLPYTQTFAHRTSEPVIDLAEALLQRAPSPMSKVMFQSSGSEAVDTAIKLAWYYFAAIGKPEKRKIIGRTKAYHGTTIAAASLTGLPNMHNGYGLPLPGFLHVSCPDTYRGMQEGETEAAYSERLAGELEALIIKEDPETIAAFFAEPVMGTGGVMVPPEGYFDAVQKVLRKHEILLVADEVICGFGRTGQYWGSQLYGLEPDMLTCAKGLSSAYFPISALMINDRVYQAIADFTQQFNGFGHGYTYGGHPVGAAVAMETLRIYDEMDICARVRSLAPLLQDGLRSLGDMPIVGNVRGVGLMAAVEFVSDKSARLPFPMEANVAGRIANAIKERGVLLRALGPSLVLSPPLIATEADIREIVAAVADSVAFIQELID